MTTAALILAFMALCVAGYAVWRERKLRALYTADGWTQLNWRLRIEANEDDIEDLQRESIERDEHLTACITDLNARLTVHDKAQGLCEHE